MCVPTSSRVSREPISRSGSNPLQGLGQAVADLLEAAGQAGIVEDEPDVVLDDPQALAGAVGRGVEDPAEVHAPAPGRTRSSGRDLLGQRDRRRRATAMPSARWSRSRSRSSPAASSRSATEDDSAISPASRCSVPTSRERSRPRGMVQRLAQDEPAGPASRARSRPSRRPLRRSASTGRIRARPSGQTPRPRASSSEPAEARTRASARPPDSPPRSTSAASRSIGSTASAAPPLARHPPAPRARSAPP